MMLLSNFINFIIKYWILFTVLILAAIMTLSLWPLAQIPLVPGGDKTHHFIAYAALMFPTALRRPSSWKLIALFFIACSGAIELIQPYVNRYGEWYDMAANLTGVVCGLLAAEFVIFVSRSKSRDPR